MNEECETIIDAAELEIWEDGDDVVVLVDWQEGCQA